MLKAVLFDMDGVIVDTEPLHRKAYYKMFDDVSIDIHDAHYESYTGRSTFNICKHLINHFNLSMHPDTLVDIKRKHFEIIFENDTELSLLDGVYDLIQDYYRNGLALVLASSASMTNIDRIFQRFDLDQYFVAKISGADLIASKPHPEIFLKAAQLSGHRPNDCIVIEDSTNGIKAARAAGIFCVGYNSPNSKNQDYSKADLVVSNFNEIRYEAIKDLL